MWTLVKMGKSLRTFIMAISFLVAELHFRPYSLERPVFQIFISQLVDYRPDVAFHDDQLAPASLKPRLIR